MVGHAYSSKVISICSVTSHLKKVVLYTEFYKLASVGRYNLLHYLSSVIISYENNILQCNTPSIMLMIFSHISMSGTSVVFHTGWILRWLYHAYVYSMHAILACHCVSSKSMPLCNIYVTLYLKGNFQVGMIDFYVFWYYSYEINNLHTLVKKLQFPLQDAVKAIVCCVVPTVI